MELNLISLQQITTDNVAVLTKLLDGLIQFLTTASEDSAFRRGGSLQILFDLLTIVFSNSSPDYRERISKCYKVHVELEPAKTKGTAGTVTKDGWIAPKQTLLKKSNAKIVSYWCFSPGFG